jgi:hypothetical protein
MADAVPPVKGPQGRPGRPRRRPAKLHLDKGVRHEALVRREALGTEGGASPPRWAVAAAWWELSAVRSGRRRIGWEQR